MVPRKPAYRREVLHKNRHAEVVLITWPAGACSAPHDHGRSHGSIRVIRGAVYHDVFDKKTKKFLRRETFKKGESFRETPAIIHIMGNASGRRPAVTVHAYTPALSMKEYPLKTLYA